MNRCWMKIVSSITMLVFASTAMFAGSGAAMLYPTGVVSLNGNAVPGATAIFQGDIVSTSGGSIASFSAPNSQISMTAQTTLKMSDKSVNLQNGVVTVNTKAGFTTRAAGYTVAPTSATARYRVLRKGNAILVASLEGPVTVKWGSSFAMVAAGGNWASPGEGVGTGGDGEKGLYPMPAAKIPKGDKRLTDDNFEGASAQSDGAGGQQAPQPVPTAKLPSDRKRLRNGTLVLIGIGMGGLATGLALSASGGQAISPVRP